MVDGRKKNNLKKFEIELNSTEDYGVDASIGASIVKLLAEGNIKTSFNKFEKTKWKVKVDFW